MILAGVSYVLHLGRRVINVEAKSFHCKMSSTHKIREDDADEVFQTSAPGAGVDDSQCVTLQLENG